MNRFAQILFLVVPVGAAVYGMAAHEAYGMGLAICGVIGAVLGFIAAALLFLVSAVVLSALCGHRRFQPKK